MESQSPFFGFVLFCFSFCFFNFLSSTFCRVLEVYSIFFTLLYVENGTLEPGYLNLVLISLPGWPYQYSLFTDPLFLFKVRQAQVIKNRSAGDLLTASARG